MKSICFIVFWLVVFILYGVNHRFDAQEERIGALELCLAEYGIVAVNNTKRTFNGTCEAWKCHATEGR